MIEKVYKGIKKCVISDYPFEVYWDDSTIFPIYSEVYNNLIQEFSNWKDPYYTDDDGHGIIKLEFIDHFILLTYRLANSLYKAKQTELANAVYYSMRVRGNIDLYYRTEFGRYFRVGHPLGTIIDSHAVYGECITIDNNVHIGPNNYFTKKRDELIHPKFGNNIMILNHACIFGKSVIGNNVLISQGTKIVDEEIPDNCIVYGSSPNLYFAPIKFNVREYLLRNPNI